MVVEGTKKNDSPHRQPDLLVPPRLFLTVISVFMVSLVCFDDSYRLPPVPMFHKNFSYGVFQHLCTELLDVAVTGAWPTGMRVSGTQ